MDTDLTQMQPGFLALAIHFVSCSLHRQPFGLAQRLNLRFSLFAAARRAAAQAGTHALSSGITIFSEAIVFSDDR